MDTTHQKLLTVDELARRLDIGAPKVRQLARAARIPFLSIGRNSLRFEFDKVVEALRAQSVTWPATDTGRGVA